MRPYALITGANGGIGRALCEAFAAAGHAVVATDRQPRAQVACSHYLQLDLVAFVRDETTARGFASALDSCLGRAPLAVLVNNAAVQILAPTAELSGADFVTSMDVNVTAPFLLTQLCLSRLRESSGAVVNIGSIHARQTKPGFVAYATSKTALAGLTRALAVDLGATVRVNAIEPAAIGTDMLLAGFEGNPDGCQALRDYHPIGRIGEPADVARAALFLASSENGFIHGATLDLSGGIHARLHDPD
jgi:NAD(P)-dependent dehydrogenase (short-subunit alcohol dehydrogenase family)